VIPLIGLILAWTNEWHGLIWSQTQPRIEGSLALLDITYGPYLWVYIAYNTLVWLISIGIFLRAALSSPYLEQRQARSLLAGAMLPGIALLIDLAGINFLNDLDLLPLGFSLAGLAFAWGLFRYQLFRIVPVARDIVLDKIMDGVLVLDKNGRIRDANPAMLRMIGCPASQVVGQPVTQLLDGQLDLVQRYRDVPKAQTQIVIYAGERLSYFEMHITALYDRRNEFNGQVLLVRDITERKQAEDAIRQAHEHLNATLNALPDMLFEVDHEGLIYDFRAPDPVLLYLQPQEFLGKTLDQIFPADVVNVINFTLTLAKEQGQYRGAVYSLPLPGGLGWFELSVAVKGELNAPDGRFVVLVRDITVRKQAEDALRENEQRYRELYAMMQRQVQEKSLLDEVRMAVARELDLPVVIRKVVDGIAETFGYSLVSLYTRAGEIMQLQHQVGYAHVIHEIPITKGVIGKVVRSGQPTLLNDVRIDADFLEAVPGVKSEVCVPLFDRGEVVGVLNIESLLEEFSEADLLLLTALGEHISIAIGRARLYTDRKLANDRLQSQLAEIQLLQAELQERTLRDPLTGLYNRRYLQETLPREFARLERLGHPLGVIILDIDHFKSVNDTYGHDAGDIVLLASGKLLQANIRTEDIACRHGGDEFVIVMPDASLPVCQERAELIRALFESMETTYK
jgi:diguanylate cyclase (GGDEF)-like protein/PAS domain S-box-containing protein